VLGGERRAGIQQDPTLRHIGVTVFAVLDTVVDLPQARISYAIVTLAVTEAVEKS
jgi:hypothetical protein